MCRWTVDDSFTDCPEEIAKKIVSPEPPKRGHSTERTRNSEVYNRTTNNFYSYNKIDINLTKALHKTPREEPYQKQVVIHLRDHNGDTLSKLIAYFPKRTSKEIRGKIIFSPTDIDYYTFAEFQTKLRLLPKWTYRHWEIFSLHNHMINGWEDIDNCTNIIVKGIPNLLQPKSSVSPLMGISTTIDTDSNNNYIKKKGSVQIQQKIKRFEIPLSNTFTDNRLKSHPSLIAVIKKPLRFHGPWIEINKKNMSVSTKAKKYLIVKFVGNAKYKKPSISPIHSYLNSDSKDWKSSYEHPDKAMIILCNKFQLSREQIQLYIEDYSKLTGIENKYGGVKASECKNSQIGNIILLKNATEASILLFRHISSSHNANYHSIQSQAPNGILTNNQCH